MSDVTREEFNGLGGRLAKIELLTPKVERNEEDIQKVFDALAKLPEANQKMLNKVIISMVVAVLIMFLKEWAVK